MSEKSKSFFGRDDAPRLYQIFKGEVWFQQSNTVISPTSRLYSGKRTGFVFRILIVIIYTDYSIPTIMFEHIIFNVIIKKIPPRQSIKWT